MESLTHLINRIGLPRIAAMALVAVLMLGFFGFLIMRAQTPNLAPLYSGLSLEDSSAIVTELQTLNIPYELRGEGDTILVPREQITTMRMTLAGEGLPTRGQVGYEIFDQQSTLGATSFVQNINNVRALEGELARTIGSLNRITGARVHLVLPERELFRRERQDPSASIVLTTRGELSTGEIRAIQHLVASAIEGLTPSRVSIVDEQGTLLASGTGDDVAGVMTAQNDERKLGFENRMRTRLEDMLANIVGAGRARVEVAAELDFNRSTTTQEVFDPESQVVRSTQTRESENLSGGNDGQVTVANELPGADQNNGAGGVTEQGTSSEEVINYEISKTTQTDVTEAGAVKRLSVAVVVDGTYADDGAGNMTYTPRSADEVAQILTLVRSAVGYDEERGDIIEVVEMPFVEVAVGEGLIDDGLFGLTKADLMRIAELLVLGVVAVLVLLLVVRPLLGRLLEVDEESLAEGGPAMLPDGSPQPALVGPDGQEIPRLPGDPGTVVATRVGDEEGSEKNLANEIDQMIDLNQVEGRVRASSVKKIGEIIENHPEEAVSIVRGWLHAEM